MTSQSLVLHALHLATKPYLPRLSRWKNSGVAGKKFLQEVQRFSLGLLSGESGNRISIAYPPTRVCSRLRMLSTSLSQPYFRASLYHKSACRASLGIIPCPPSPLCIPAARHPPPLRVRLCPALR